MAAIPCVAAIPALFAVFPGYLSASSPTPRDRSRGSGGSRAGPPGPPSCRCAAGCGAGAGGVGPSVDVVVLGAKAGVAAVLLVAAGAKLADRGGFADTVRLFVPRRARRV